MTIRDFKNGLLQSRPPDSSAGSSMWSFVEEDWAKGLPDCAQFEELSAEDQLTCKEAREKTGSSPSFELIS